MVRFYSAWTWGRIVVLGLALVLPIVPLLAGPHSNSQRFLAKATSHLQGSPLRAGSEPGCTGTNDIPGRLSASVVGTTVTLQWLAPFGCTPTTYSVLVGSSPNLSNLANISTGNSSTTFTASGVAAGIYYVRVAAQSGAVRSTPSNEIAVAVGLTCELPGAPLALAATATASTASLEWDRPVGLPTSYLIEAGSAPGLSNLVTLTSIGQATGLSTAAPAGTYYVRVRARNACGTGEPSNEVVVVVTAPTAGSSDWNGSLILTGNQVMVVSAASFTVRGRIELHDASMLIIRDSSFTHAADYAGQFDLWAYDDSKVIIERSTVDSSAYVSWRFFDRSMLQMTHVVNQSALWSGFQQRARGTYAYVTRAYGTGAEGSSLQVHHAGESFIELVFPPGATVDEALPASTGTTAYQFPGAGEIGVRHTLAMTSVPSSKWGITYNPESNITIRQTTGLVVTMNIPSTYSGLMAQFDGLRAGLYRDQVWDTGASRLRLVETTTLPWSPIVAGNNALIITNSELADIANVYDTASVFIADSTLTQVRAHNRVRYTLERSYVSGDVVASDDSVITMTGGGIGGRPVRDPSAQMVLSGVLTHSPEVEFGYITSITARQGEVLSGGASLKASYSGTEHYTSIVRANRALVPLIRGRTYTASFGYRILTTPSQGFELTFASSTAFAQGVYLPSLVINGAPGTTGTGTLTVTLGAYDDYEVGLSIVGTGSILIDDFRIADSVTGVIVNESVETILAAP
ncbi:hypothetical protein [Caenimonas aquaedulcis]|uniref:Fibronectin type-III domain-containing protein n=1 Tax=Caenimonas aquaedulcis TaxID=2793270 RepID=A0A931H8F0_9BURK|nr:hypothetical protein [Caenimonas aquaedulcis]MBG9390610.1 hypothetical protein [Caenimonas aquaedulcis]